MVLDHVTHLNCLVCGKSYRPDQVDYVCPDHGYEGILDLRYDYEAIRARFSRQMLSENRELSIWRYKPLLPVAADAVVPPLAVGWTPLYKTDRLASTLGIRHLWVKDDGRQPTASFKDRASAMAIVKAAEKGATVITTASTGNAAAALSGLCASIDQANVIFVPESAPQAKITQLLVFGSTVVLVKGNYGNAYDLCMTAVEQFGWYNRNTGYNPYMTEGKKTVSFEIAEQMDWKVPDKVFVSVGDGCIIGGVLKGFRDLYEMGWIDRIPQLFGVQAEGSSFLYEAWKNEEEVLTKPEIDAQTIADSISAGMPRDRIKAMAAVTDTDGAFICVSDSEILSAIPEMARGCGVFAEPAGAAAYAGLKKAIESGQVNADDTVVVISTGNGLKDISSALKACQDSGTHPIVVSNDFEQLQQALKEQSSGGIV